MSVEIELERTFLAKSLPEGLDNARSEIISDIFVPQEDEHPVVRIRRRGERYEITKKEPVKGRDSSAQAEHTISLTPAEYGALKTVQGKKFTKRRHYVDIAGFMAEVDVYLEDLAGLVIIDFEFSDEQSLEAFVMPDICLMDVTQERLMAGGMIAGKTYEDLRPILEEYGYKPLGGGEV